VRDDASRTKNGDSSLSWFVAEQLDGIEFKSGGYSFHRFEREVPLTSLQTTDIRSVPTEDLRECLLGQATFFAVTPQIDADDSLEISLGHARTVAGLLLDGLQTYK
jgi:hypothetical protein